jgi:small subunit ribosomal protein S4
VGDPKKQRKKYETPRFPWRSDILESELRLLGEFGLRNKRELWAHKTFLSKFRSRARSLHSTSTPERIEQEDNLLRRLKNLKILNDTAVLDNVFDLGVEALLERRLQTVVLKQGLAKTIFQARQLITHGHIAINDKKISSPNYLVSADEEVNITYTQTSSLANSKHPLRKSIENNISEGGNDE